MHDLSELVFRMEHALLTTLIHQIKSGELSVEDGKSAMREFLALRPFADLDDLKTKIKAFAGAHKEFMPAYVALLHHEDLQKSEGILSQFKEHFTAGNLDKAFSVLK